MAERYRTAAGNWSNAAQWDGGVALPGVGDDCYSNNFAITIDQNVTVASIRNTAGVTAVAGGSFTGAAGFTANATHVYAGTVSCLTSAVNFTVNGTSHGGSAANARGVSFTGFGIHNGDSIGGTNASAAGTNLQGSSVQNGNSFAATAPGTTASGGGTQIGNSFGQATGVVGTQIAAGGYHIGDSNGGTTASSSGTSVSGGIHYGRCIGGTNATAYGTLLQAGGLCIATQIVAGTAPGVRLVNDAAVILQGGSTTAQVSNGASAGRFSITRGTSPSKRFVRPPTNPSSPG